MAEIDEDMLRRACKPISSEDKAVIEEARKNVRKSLEEERAQDEMSGFCFCGRKCPGGAK